MGHKGVFWLVFLGGASSRAGGGVEVRSRIGVFMVRIGTELRIETGQGLEHRSGVAYFGGG